MNKNTNYVASSSRALLTFREMIMARHPATEVPPKVGGGFFKS